MSEDLSKRIESLLLAYRTRCWLDGDGNGTPLIYVFSPPSDLTTGLGRSEVSELADYLAGELAAAIVSDGWKLVPPECTDAMEEAFWETPGDQSVKFRYRRMLKAVPAALASLTPTEPTK